MSARAQMVRELTEECVGALSHSDLLVRCFSTGSERFWAEFVRRFNRVISLAVIRAYCQCAGRGARYVDADLVDDIIQDVYLKLFEMAASSIAPFRGTNDAAVFAYIGKVAVSVVVDRLRRASALKRRTSLVSMDVITDQDEGRGDALSSTLVAPGPSPEQIAMDSAVRRTVTRWLDELLSGRNAARDRRIAEEFLFEERSPAEIAARIGGGVGEAAVKSSLKRTNGRLREELSRRELVVRRTGRPHLATSAASLVVGPGARRAPQRGAVRSRLEPSAA